MGETNRKPWMKTLRNVVTGVAACLALAACGSPVTVPSGYVGRQVSTSGLSNENWAPGAYRMNTCWASACPTMVLLQTGFSSEEVTIHSVFLPKSNVDLADVTLAVQFHVKDDAKSVDALFANVSSKPSKDGSETRWIDADDIYRIYLQRIVPNILIDVLRQYSVEQALSDVHTISVARSRRSTTRWETSQSRSPRSASRTG